jgi:predicted metal-dependent phosphotriesterase family hydrolase
VLAGRAHLATNIPIFTHTGIPGKSALEQLDIFEDVCEGSPSRSA